MALALTLPSLQMTSNAEVEGSVDDTAARNFEDDFM